LTVGKVIAKKAVCSIFGPPCILTYGNTETANISATCAHSGYCLKIS